MDNKSLLEELLPDLMCDALKPYMDDIEFLAENVRKYLEAGPGARADILAFFKSDGPSIIHESVLKDEEGIPTSADLEQWAGGVEQAVLKLTPATPSEFIAVPIAYDLGPSPWKKKPGERVTTKLVNGEWKLFDGGAECAAFVKDDGAWLGVSRAKWATPEDVISFYRDHLKNQERDSKKNKE